ncbi:MAG: type II secretion system protein [Fimbriimonas sp.]
MKKGFTLIELLVVIAIIAILAGITFPVFARAKDSAYRGSDMANMNAIRTALQLYRTDQGAHPPALLGYVSTYDGNVPTATNVIPANEIVGALYPKRVESLQTFRPAYVRPTAGSLEKEFSTAVWPPKAAVGGDVNKEQRFGPEQIVQRCVNGAVVDNHFYRISGYDAATVKAAGVNQHELRYTLFWTRYAVPVDPCNPLTDAGSGSGSDDTRQLGYTDPPDSTVVTWDSYFRDYNSDGSVQRIKRDLVLFLGGGARPYDSAAVASQSWQVKP